MAKANKIIESCESCVCRSVDKDTMICTRFPPGGARPPLFSATKLEWHCFEYRAKSK